VARVHVLAVDAFFRQVDPWLMQRCDVRLVRMTDGDVFFPRFKLLSLALTRDVDPVMPHMLRAAIAQMLG
jgi:hypothetical protein